MWLTRSSPVDATEGQEEEEEADIFVKEAIEVETIEIDRC